MANPGSPRSKFSLISSLRGSDTSGYSI